MHAYIINEMNCSMHTAEDNIMDPESYLEEVAAVTEVEAALERRKELYFKNSFFWNNLET